MAKRANGEGNIRKRTDGKWLVTFPTGLYKESGKREYIYRYAGTQTEAAEILRQLQAEKGMGVSQSRAAIRAGDWMETWIEKHKAPKLAPATLTSYRNNFRIHIRPYIGDIVLRELSTYHIQRCLDAIGGSCSTFVKNYNIIHGSLDKAIVCHDYASHSAPQVVQDFCKTKSSKRKVIITTGLVGVLKEHKTEMMKRVEQSGEEWSESHLVFPNTRGNMVHNRNLQNSLYRIFAKCGIEGATMHTLRHTYATRCFEAGVDIKAISEQLGHANVKTTYNIYVHLLEDTKEKEIDKLDGIDKLLA